MRRSTGIAAVAAALTLVTMAVLALPAIAAAADSQGSYAGTYTGVASGRDAKGKKGTSGVTVWVQVSGDKTTFTFRFDKLPVVVNQTGTSQSGASGKTVVPLSIDKSGIRGSGTMTFSVSKQRWLLYGNGSGKALRYKGTGKLVAWRVSTGVALPSTVTQITDLFSALAGGKPSTSAEMNAAAAGSSGAAGSSPSPEASGQPSGEALSVGPPAASATAGPDAAVTASSVIDLAAQEPPVDDMKKLSALGLLLLIVTMSLALGLSTPEGAGLEANEPLLDQITRQPFDPEHPDRPPKEGS
jgi:hypothetical protein